MIKIRRAEVSDIPNIMRFLDEHWKSGNILAKDRDFFEWQFVDDDDVNMFIAIDEEVSKIFGTYGFVRYNHSNHPDISGSAWQVIKSGNPMLGLDITKCVSKTMNSRYDIGPHLSKKTQKIHKLRGRRIIAMDHFYRLNPYISEFHLAVVKDKMETHVEDVSRYGLKKLNTAKDMEEVIPENELMEHIPAKDYCYIRNRYYNHPIYNYSVWAVVPPDEKAKCVIVTREAEYDRAKCLKIVDCYGRIDDFSHITHALDELMKNNEDEYADIYSFGVPTEIYKKCGMIECGVDSQNIIPNYFHPFVQENVQLITSDQEVSGMRYFRGDGDQDRPG